MRYLILFFALLLFGCSSSSSTDFGKAVKCSMKNLSDTAVQVVFEDDESFIFDNFRFKENDEIVKTIPNQRFHEGDTLVITYNLKDSTDYYLYGSNDYFTANDKIYNFQSTFWYDSKGDTLNFNPPYDRVMPNKKVVN